MYKSTILTVFMLTWASAAVASTQTVNLSPKAAHTLDFSSLGCTVEKAFFGDPAAGSYFDINLDQPQPQTQKITLRWKPKSDVDDAFLQLHLKGCSQGYAQIEIKRVDAVPASPVTYINSPVPVARTPAVQPPPVAQQPQTPGLVPVPKSQPLSLNSNPQPQTVKRPPVRRLSVPKQSQKVLIANRFKPSESITPTRILKGLNVARSKGEIGYRSEMHYRVNSMIRAMRRGSEYQTAGQQAGVPEGVVQALVSYSQPQIF